MAFCGKCGAPLAAQPAGLTPADLDHLRRYLPSALVEALQFDLRAPPPRLIEQCQAYLHPLLTTTASHLPAYLVQRVARNPIPGQTGGQFFRGTLLFADISGFTAMSEKLSRVGREGAEELTVIVNRYFGVMLEVLRAHDGQLIKFGGDALFSLFLEPPHDSALRAVQAALHMQAAMRDFAQTQTSQGVFTLQIKIGLRRGQFFAAELGAAQGMEYALFGADVNATAAAEAAAAAGQVLLDPNTWSAVSLPGQTSPGPPGYLVVERLEGEWQPPASPPPDADPLPRLTEPTLDNLRQLIKVLDALTPYLPAGVLTRLRDTRTLQIEGEHRLVAVLFANVVGLGEFADRLGPGQEDQIVASLNRYFLTMEDALRQFGGVVNKIDLYEHGDKLLAFFGAPVAHEDDAERAVRAAWAMQSALNGEDHTLQEAFAPSRLQQRIGISYGYAFAGHMGTHWRHEYTVMGDEVNLAARLMSAAPPDSVTISSNVLRKVRSLFHLTPRGSVTLKGKSAPFRLFTVEGLRAIPEPVRGLEGLRAPLVGREAEWRKLLNIAEELLAGRGQIVSITGEAGVGKSRLVAEWRDYLHAGRGSGVRWAEGRCLSYTESISYLPFQEIVRELIGLRAQESALVATAKVREALHTRLPPDEAQTTLPYVLNFLDLPLDEAQHEKVRYLDAEALRRRVFLALAHLIEAYAPSQAEPLALILDDIHWMDPASLDLLEYLLPSVERAPLILMLLYREERAKGCWKVHEKAVREFPHCTLEIALRSLAPDDSQRLLTSLIPPEAWPASLRNQILEHTEGNPLFMEEMLRILLDKRLLTRDETGRWQFTDQAVFVEIPDSLQGVLMARLDTLEEPPRRTAQVAAVIGRNFVFDVLAAVAPEPEAELNPHLARLMQYEIVHETQRAPELVYAYKHSLMQQVCYEALLTRTRRDYHRKIAVYLESRYTVSEADAASALPLIAQHAFLGQDWPRALRYQSLAGQRAQKLFANQEALDHFQKALQSAGHLPPEETSAEQQLICAALGELLITTGQYEPALGYLERARALAVERGNAAEQARACRWLGKLYEVRGDYDPAFEWIQRTLDILAGQETSEAAEALLIAGLINTRQGRFDRALEHCENALRIGQNLGEVTVLARSYNLMGIIAIRRGASAAAAEHFQRALELYQAADHIQGQALSQNQLANAYFYTGRWREADHHYRRARETFEQLGDVYNRAFVDNNLGGIALNQGRLDEALTFYRAALRTSEQIGASLFVLGALHMNLGAVFARRGETQTAREHLNAAQEHFDKAQARDFLPELYRHFAEAALAAHEFPEAEARGRQALSLARELGIRGEEGNSLRVLGETAAAQDQWGEAETALVESVAILEEVADEYELARSRFWLARIHATLGRREAGVVGLDRCLEVFERLEADLDLQAARELRRQLADAT